MASLRVLTSCLAILVLVAPASAGALSVVATANGSASPTQLDGPATISNGDFSISGPADQPVGDGGNEITTWDFDFSGEASLPAVEAAGLASALLTLTLNNFETSTDLVGIVGLPLLGPPELQDLLQGASETIQIELLGPGRYTSAQVLGALDQGVLAMRYEDDAILSFAQLELVAVPEPAAALLLLALLAGLARRR